MAYQNPPRRKVPASRGMKGYRQQAAPVRSLCDRGTAAIVTNPPAFGQAKSFSSEKLFPCVNAPPGPREATLPTPAGTGGGPLRRLASMPSASTGSKAFKAVTCVSSGVQRRKMRSPRGHRSGRGLGVSPPVARCPPRRTHRHSGALWQPGRPKLPRAGTSLPAPPARLGQSWRRNRQTGLVCLHPP